MVLVLSELIEILVQVGIYIGKFSCTVYSRSCAFTKA